MKKESKEKNKKAFVLSLDALLATVIVLMVTSFAVYHFSNIPERTTYIYNFKEVSDTAAVLDNLGLLNVSRQVEALETTSKILPNYYVRFTLTNVNIDLTEEKSESFGELTEEPQGFTMPAQRFFTVKNESGNIVQFGYAKMIAWRKS